MSQKVIPPQTEAAFLAQVLALARLRLWRTYHARPARTAKGWRTSVQGDGKGWPDLFLVRGPRAVAAELKRMKAAKPTQEQQSWLTSLQEAGIEAYLWTPESWREIERVLV